VHAACDLNITVKGEGLLKVTGSHIHWKSDNISEMVLDSTLHICLTAFFPVLDKDVVSTHH